MNFKNFVILCCFSSYLLNGQIVGNIVNTDGKSIPFVNIIHFNSKYGTVSDKDGHFILPSNKVQIGDTLIFSHLTYSTIERPVSQEKMILEMAPIEEKLEAISVFSKPTSYHVRKIGRISSSGSGMNLFHQEGAEMGRYINVPRGKVFYLRNLKFSFDNVKRAPFLFRINFYEINPNIAKIKRPTTSAGIFNQNKFEKMDDAGVSLDSTNLKLRFLTFRLKIELDDQMSLTPVNQNEILLEVTEDGQYDVNLRHEMLYMENDFIATMELLDFEKKSSYQQHSTNEELLGFKQEPHEVSTSDDASVKARVRVNVEAQENKEDLSSEKERPSIGIGLNMYASPIYFRAHKKQRWAKLKMPLGFTMAMELTVHQFDRTE
ncbi:MAG: carboxypeptidase-like regulatory domain-containing protein [Flavobacteriaceae bacterium]|nr:carboxypeptidase-like regulatory domain-containing protein [Flavobacteriaceae bacterium]